MQLSAGKHILALLKEPQDRVLGNLLLEMISIDPQKRPTADAALCITDHKRILNKEINCLTTKNPLILGRGKDTDLN